MPAVVVTILVWVGTKAASAAASAAVSKLVGIPVNMVLGINVEGATLGTRMEAVALGLFTGNMVPEPTFEQKVAKSFLTLQTQLGELKQDLTELRDEMATFQWHVQSKFNESDEEKLWKDMLSLDHTLDSFYTQLNSLGKSKASLEDKRWRAVELANNIVSSLRPQVANTQMSFLGESVGAGRERVQGFLEIWQQQALRDADTGWDGQRLADIYVLLESKFTRALLIQVKCVRLLMEAYEALQKEDPSEQGGVDFLVDEYYPVLKREVEGFRDIVETLAVNLIPLPTGQMLPLNVPEQIAGMLARLDMFTAQALAGKISDGGVPASGRQLPGVPAVTGLWGRVVVPGTRWIRRAPGSKEAARVIINAQGGRTVTCNGTLEVRAVKYLPYKNPGGTMLHKGYQLQVGNEPRDMDKMLVAHFTPTDVLPRDLPEGEAEVKLEDQGGDVLAQTQAFVVPIPLDEEQKATAPYGTFTMAFTGAAGLRGR